MNFAPVSDWKSSPTSWFELPVPPDAIAIRPGFAFASAMSSFTDLSGEAGATRIASASVGRSMSAASSRGIVDSMRVNAQPARMAP